MSNALTEGTRPMFKRMLCINHSRYIARSLLALVVLVCCTRMNPGLLGRAWAGEKTLPRQRTSSDSNKRLRVGFQELPYSLPGTYVTYSSNGKWSAIVRCNGSNDSAEGSSVEVWSIDNDCKPLKIVYKDHRKVIFSPEAQWVGPNLCYSVRTGMATSKPIDQLNVTELLRLTHGYLWSSSGGRRDFPPAASGLMISSADGTMAVVVDPLSSVLSQANTGERHSTNDFFHQRTLNSYRVPYGNLLDSVKAPLLPPNGISSESPLIPLFVTEDHHHLFSVAYTDFPWSGKSSVSRSNAFFLVSVDLSSGKVFGLTSDDDQDQLFLTDRRFSGVGSPASIADGKLVVCQLTTSGWIYPLRFAYFTSDGHLTRMLNVRLQDLKRAGLPAGSVITWTPDGKVLLQTRDVWLLDLNTWKSTLIAKSLHIDNVYGWTKGGHLLVKARKLIGDRDVIVSEVNDHSLLKDPILSNKELWGVLTVP